ncbi:Protein white, partial [Durusdinium trenchii]
TGSNKQEVNFSGEVFARGRPVKTSFFRGKTAFVFQDGVQGFEILLKFAYLRLSRKVSKSKRDDLVEKLLDDLHLQEISTPRPIFHRSPSKTLPKM